MTKPIDRKAMFLMASRQGDALRVEGYSLSDLLGAGYSAYALLGAGYSLSALRVAGYSLSALRVAGYSLSDLLGAGYSAYALRVAGYSLSALEEILKDVPKLEKPYTKMLADINAGQRKHSQAHFGPECDPGQNLCGTQMCTAGHLVNMAGQAGYDLKNKTSWEWAATLLHMKAHPDVPPQNFGSIEQEWAMAYIEEMAEIEAGKEAGQE